MLRLRKLYTEPKLIEPIEFKDGINLILGVEDNSSDKTNGVGKSLCIEFINFALLKQKSQSRVSRIPDGVFPSETYVCLDIEIFDQQFTIQRSLADAETPKFIGQDKVIEFSKLEDARAFLREKLFGSELANTPSFRSMMGPLIRDERSEFKSLISCYDTDQRVPDDYSPHMYTLGLNIETYLKIRAAIVLIDGIGKDIKKIKDNVLLLRQKDIKDARSDLNELDSEVASINRSIEALENITGYEAIKDDIVKLEDQLETIRREKLLLSQKLSRTKLITSGQPLERDEIEEFYSQISERLGELIVHDLDQVLAFQDKVNGFQNQLIREQRDQLENEISYLNRQVSELDKQYQSKLVVLDQSGALKNLKQTYAAFQTKVDEASQLKAFISKFDELEIQKQAVRSHKETELLQLQSDILNHKMEIESFEKTILQIHEYVQGNRRASFDVRQSNRKQVLEISLRIDDDGSHSVEREKVFIYDLALLVNEFTSSRHPGILVHDNIFDVDQDTLMKNIQYLVAKANFSANQQYLLTLNADRLDESTRAKIVPFVRQQFTKQNRFLNVQYQEQKK